ncbi:MAG: hypothetical protein QF463_01835 [Vicinamibacterales bacterium]|jgi:hypothetical protein|nr:hypothetical protein [Vicinamibacterales bacterium]
MFRHALTTIAGEPASRLGLAAYPDQQEACARTAFRGGVNYFFFYSIGQQSVIRGLRPLLVVSRIFRTFRSASLGLSDYAAERCRLVVCSSSAAR